MDSVKVYKIGGKVLSDMVLLDTFLNEIASSKVPKVIIHGGGNKASQVMKSMGVEPQMIEGRRVTDEKTLEIVTMVYAGLMNKGIVAQLQSKRVNAIGLSGADMNMIQSHKREVKEIDYGLVGDIDEVNGIALYQLCDQGYVPVICPITHDKKGQLLNTNADTIAAQVSIALAEHVDVALRYCFELQGVLRDFDDKDSVISELTEDQMNSLYKEGVINDGMIPKLKTGFDAINGGVKEVSICHISKLNELSEGTNLVG